MTTSDRPSSSGSAEQTGANRDAGGHAPPGWWVDRQIRFSHCDPAGIAFMPRFFELLNEVCEDWFVAIGHDYTTLIIHRRLGLGYAHAQANFEAPAFMGDLLRFTLSVGAIGTKSLTLNLAGRNTDPHGQVGDCHDRLRKPQKRAHSRRSPDRD